MSIIDWTDGWLTDWSEEGGEFKEWVRHMHLSAMSGGWLRAIAMEPVYFWRNLCHVISWVPVLWKDRDWDHAYLLIMMREKLKRMRLLHQEKGNAANREEIAHSIMVVEQLLDRLIKDDYCAKEFDEHWKKFEVDKRWSSKEKTADGQFYTIPPPTDEERKDSKRLHDREETLRKQDLELFGKLFAKHVRNWWD